MEVYEALDRLRAAAGDDPDSGAPEISADRSRIVVRWHGAVPAAVQAVVDQYATGPFTVVVEQTPFPPGELLTEAGRLVEAHPGVVSAAGPRSTGDGIDVMIRPGAVDAAGSLDHALVENGVVSDFPLFPSSGTVEPA